MYKYIHTCTYIHINMSAHIHTYTMLHIYTYKNIHMNARKHTWNDGAAANVRGAVADARSFALLFRSTQSSHISHLMQGLHCTHFLNRQYPSNPHLLFPTYPRTVHGPRASAVLLFYTDQMIRVHSSEKAPRTFTVAPCVVVERLEGKQRCSRAAVSEHAGIQVREWSRWLFTRNEGSLKNNQPPQASPSRNHDSATPRQHPLICTGAEPMHQVHGPPKPRARSRCSEIEFTFSPFSRRFYLCCLCNLYVWTGVGVYVGVCVCICTHTHTRCTWGTRMPRWAQGLGQDKYIVHNFTVG